MSAIGNISENQSSEYANTGLTDRVLYDLDMEQNLVRKKLVQKYIPVDTLVVIYNEKLF